MGEYAVGLRDLCRPNANSSPRLRQPSHPQRLPTKRQTGNHDELVSFIALDRHCLSHANDRTNIRV